MLGAVIGDIAGSAYEWDNVKTEDFVLFGQNSRFTDDTVMSCATAEAVLCLREHTEIAEEHTSKVYATLYKKYYGRYPDAGYGAAFAKWAQDERLFVQGSYGNGASMRISPIGFAFDRLEDVLVHAERSCLYTHNNREAISGAQAVAGSIFLARGGKSKGEIRRFVQKTAGYNLNLKDFRERHSFSSRTKLSVPAAITAFLEADSYEDTVRRAIAAGGDSDTIACIAGGIAQAFYGKIPDWMRDKAMERLDPKLLDIIGRFQKEFM